MDLSGRQPWSRWTEAGEPCGGWILVQQLVRQELVERSEDTRDRRRAWVRLTERGARLVGNRRERQEAEFLPRLNRLSDKELIGLQRGLEALISVIREERQQ